MEILITVGNLLKIESHQLNSVLKSSGIIVTLFQKVSELKLSDIIFCQFQKLVEIIIDKKISDLYPLLTEMGLLKVIKKVVDNPYL